MAVVLEATRFAWDLIKEGARVEVNQRPVNVVPVGTRREDLGGWKGPISFTEQYRQESAIFGEELVNFGFKANWEYNDKYIANFNVVVEGTVALFSSIDVRVETLDARLDDGVAVLPYQIQLTFRNIIGGTTLTVFRGEAMGNGGGRSLA